MTDKLLPKTWVNTTIGELLKPQSDGKLIHQGWSPRCHTEKAPEGKWGVLKTTAVQDGYYLEEANKCLPDDKDPKPRIEVSQGDLLMTNAGPRARCGVTTLVRKTRGKLMISGKMYRMRFNEQHVHPKYMEACFRSAAVKKEIDDRKTGISESGLNLTQQRFLSVPLILCPYQEQTRIANKLDELLAQVNNIKARVDNIPTILKRFRQSVLAAAVSGKLTEEWRLTVSEDWRRLQLADIVSKIEAGKSLKCIERPPLGNEFGIIKISAVTWGVYDEEESKTLPDKDLFIESRRIEVGDFLISRANTIELLGNPVIVHEVTKNLMLSDKVLRLVMPEADKAWVSIFLRSFDGRKAIEERSTGNQDSMRNIGQKALLSIVCPKPGKEEQAEIVRLVEQFFAFADQVEQQVAAAQSRIDNLTQSILAKAFRGELVPQDSNDEPASELLKRIQQEREQAAELAKAAKKAAKKTAKQKAELDKGIQPEIFKEDSVLGVIKKRKGAKPQDIFDELKDIVSLSDVLEEITKLLKSKSVEEVDRGGVQYLVAKK